MSVTGGHYSQKRAKRSLIQFGLGKLLSASLGVALLVWLVRAMPAAEYGRYLTVFAILEVFYLVTGFGLSTLAQRYVAEFRLKAPAPQFRAFLHWLLWRRVAQAAACAAILWWLLPQLSSYWGINLPPQIQLAYAFWLVTGSMTRYMDELLPALLLQGVSQILNALANAVRLTVVAVVVLNGSELLASHLILMELALSTVLACVGAGSLYLYVKRHPGAEGTPDHVNLVMHSVARRFYIVQVLGQFWSGNAAKLLVTRLAGLSQTALFGFCQSMVDMLRNYLPAYMLANWVRPLMVAQYVKTGSVAPVAEMANAVFKLSLIGLLPFAAFFATHGESFASLVSKGRYSAGADLLLTSLTLMAALQCLHIVVGMVTTTVERAGANVWATALGCFALPVAYLLHGEFGLPGIVWAFCAADMLWVTVVLYWLAKSGFSVGFDWLGVLKALLAAALVAGLLWSLPPPMGLYSTLLTLAIAVVTLAILLAIFKPLKPAERDLFARIVPRRLIVW